MRLRIRVLAKREARELEVMSYGFGGKRAKKSSHTTNLFASSLNCNKSSVDQKMKYWSENQLIPKNQLLVGVGFFVAESLDLPYRELSELL